MERAQTTSAESVTSDFVHFGRAAQFYANFVQIGSRLVRWMRPVHQATTESIDSKGKRE